MVNLWPGLRQSLPTHLPSYSKCYDSRLYILLAFNQISTDNPALLSLALRRVVKTHRVHLRCSLSALTKSMLAFLNVHFIATIGLPTSHNAITLSFYIRISFLNAFPTAPRLSRDRNFGALRSALLYRLVEVIFTHSGLIGLLFGWPLNSIRV